MMTAIMSSDQLLSFDPGRAVVCDGGDMLLTQSPSPPTAVLPAVPTSTAETAMATTMIDACLLPQPAETIYLESGLKCVDLRGGNMLLYPNALRDWYNIMLESFPNPNEFDQLESFGKMLRAEYPYEHMNQTTSCHLIVCMRGDDEVLGGIHFHYHAHCKSALLAYVVVSSNTRGMGIGKKLFDTAVRMLESAHPELEAIFAETHGMSVEDGVYPTAHRQKYFADLGFVMVDVPYITPILPGRATPCFDYLLIVRPCGRAMQQGERATGIRTSLLRTFVASYWEYASRHLFAKATDGPYYRWLVEHGGLAVCQEPYAPSLVSYTTEDTEDDYNPGIYTPLLETPWEFTMHEEMLDYFFWEHQEEVLAQRDANDRSTLPAMTMHTKQQQQQSQLLSTFLSMGACPCACTRCTELFAQCQQQQQQATLLLPPPTAAGEVVSITADIAADSEEEEDEEDDRRGGSSTSVASSSPRMSRSSSSDDDDDSWDVDSI